MGQDPPLLERESESRALAAALDRARAAVGAAVLVIGEAGIGKTALLRQAAEGASDCRVLTARGTRLERDYGYGVVRQLFDPVLHDVVLRERLLADPVITRALPALGLATTARDTDEAGDRDAEFATRDGLYWLLADLAQDRPVVVVVDDAHWADDESLRWLLHLLSRLGALAVAVLVGWRAPEQSTPEDLLEEIRASPEVAEIGPRPLSLAAARRLAGAVDPAVAHELSAGNPFYLTELLRSGADQPRDAPVAETVRRHVLQRLRPLPAACTDLARTLAVLDSDSPLALAATVAGLDPSDALRAVDRLVEAGLVERGDRLRFAHPVLRAAVYGSQPLADLESAHGRAASALAEDHPDRAATHLLATVPRGDPRVVDTLVAAARRSIEAAAPGPARALLRRALEEPPAHPYAVVALLGRAQSLYGDPAAGDTYRRAIDLAADLEQRTHATRGLASHYGALDRLSESVDVLKSAIQALAEAGDPDPQQRLHLEADLALAGLYCNPRAAEVAARVTRLTEGMQPNTTAHRRLLIARAYALLMTGSIDAAHATDLLVGSMPDPSYLAEHELDSPGPSAVLGCLGWCDRPDLVQPLAEALEARARRDGSMLNLVSGLTWRAIALHDLGHLVEAEAVAREAVLVRPALSFPAADLIPLMALLPILVARGDLDAAEAVLGQAGYDRALPGPTMAGMTMVLGRMELRLAQHRPDLLLADIEWTRGQTELRGGSFPGVHQAAEVADALVPGLGALAAAATTAEARAHGAPARLARCLLVRARLDAGDPEPLLREALDLVEGTVFRLDLARALQALGAHLRRTGRRAEARPLLERALDLASVCGAVPLADEARTELLACGARPRRGRLSGEQSLTPSELRVAHLAAAGRTNREIAQQLFVTRSTVETHLSAAYRKLDVTSRAGLREVLA